MKRRMSYGDARGEVVKVLAEGCGIADPALCPRRLPRYARCEGLGLVRQAHRLAGGGFGEVAL
eukprot:TRINITY_DN3122_c0_g1_i1.p3 TRINITY_DN3122_c0_g1~~TRINITY_DN3122_c0_g1_i1.p3  ORF type:complete len:63 (-),score=4.16 TRINITY_DN3122_c0_g1_i1:184-372(-)